MDARYIIQNMVTDRDGVRGLAVFCQEWEEVTGQICGFGFISDEKELERTLHLLRDTKEQVDQQGIGVFKCDFGWLCNHRITVIDLRFQFKADEVVDL